MALTTTDLPIENPGSTVASTANTPWPRLHQFFDATADRVPDRIAVEDTDSRVTYRELEQRANKLAHHLRQRGIADGARVGILLERSTLTYVSLLGILKAGAAFVPIDPAAPAGRITYIAEDAQLDLLVTSSDLAIEVSDLGRPLLELDLASDILATAPPHRPAPSGEGDSAAYVIYTSGSSGRPKGVEVANSSICNFIEVVPGVYDVREDDRVYQGMSISFDFSIEEIWPTWAVGATLVVGPNDSRRIGEELANFLDETGVTVFYCVPTLLATIPRELPRVRGLMVGGEACPAKLVERWSTGARRMLNTYGPTEATVTATWCELLPGRPVTIGKPMPTYTVVLLDEEQQPVPDGEVGEVCIGGKGVANGYVGMADKTADRFVRHALAPDGGRLYRTGDLGRVTAGGEIEYLGRADAEVKVRGQRVDLGEIESVLLEDSDVASAVVALVRISEDNSELAAYVTRGDSAFENEPRIERLHKQLTHRLPGYMVPAFLDVLAELPTMPSGKVDRARLPAPRGPRLSAPSGPVVPPATDLEKQIAAVWADVFGCDVGQLSVAADFFDDLGGHSLLAATAVSRLREDACPRVAVRDLYANPTVRSMAEHLDSSAEPDGAAEPAPRPEPIHHRQRRVGISGTAQVAFLYVLLALGTLPVAVVYGSYEGAVAVAGVLGDLATAAVVSYLGLRWLLPPLLVRALSVGIRPGRYPLWGVTYVRLWALDLVLGIAPLPVLSGSPLLNGYLRLLGARVGPRAHIATSAVSLPTLVRIDGDAALGYGVHIRPWHVQDGWVVVDQITVRAGAFVGASTQLEPGAHVGPMATVGEHSDVGVRQIVPAGEVWRGSPSTPTGKPDPGVDAMLDRPPQGWAPRDRAGVACGLVLIEAASVIMVVPSIVMVWAALLTWGTGAGLLAAALVGPVFVLTVCAVVAGLRRCVLPHAPAGIHPARCGLGVRKWIADKLLETSLILTNSLYSTLYTAPWLRLLGARVGRGAEISTVAYIEPELLRLGEGSFVADMASVGSARFYNGYMNCAHTEVGRRAFIGNAAVVPSGTWIGDGSLVGVHTVPPGAEVPVGTSWLGSPAMYLPRRQDSGSFDEERTFRPPRHKVAERLAIEFFRVTAPASIIAVAIYLSLLALSTVAGATGAPATVLLAPALFTLGSIGVLLFVVALKWAVVGRYRPRIEPLWSGFVRRTELVTGIYEAAAVPTLLAGLTGTPLLPPVLRLFGAKIGPRAWIGTTFLTEFDLVQIGRDAAVGRGVSLQTHLFEDRVMKMSRVRVGDGAAIGDRSIVLYDARIGDGAALDGLSLAMKGEQLPPTTRWRGIPAQGTQR